MDSIVVVVRIGRFLGDSLGQNSAVDASDLLLFQLG
jgi:hypothetical protein